MHSVAGQPQQRRAFLEHLTNWSLDHDASLHFQGKLSLLPRTAQKGASPELGKPVTCVLTDASFPDARQTVVIKLFPPQQNISRNKKVAADDERRDSLDLYNGGKPLREEKTMRYQTATPGANGRYKLLIRCGAGWMPSREYLNKVYFSRLESQSAMGQTGHTLSDFLSHRSKSLGPAPSAKDSITIRPLFRPFRQLPAELQEMVLLTAAGMSRNYDLTSDDYGYPSVPTEKSESAISLSTLFRVSKSINEHLHPFIYHSTDFHFGLTGFTNFLWQSGAARKEIRRLTFHFGKLALLHCIRWLAPDPVFALFEPPVATSPRALQYFWRCQIQDLAKELDLLTLTLDVENVPEEELPMIVAILKESFGSVEKILFVDGEGKRVDVHEGVKESRSWREMCEGYFERHQMHSYFFKFELLKAVEGVLGERMDGDRGFFDGRFEPLVGMKVDAETKKGVKALEG
jgi:hypothetical protein